MCVCAERQQANVLRNVGNELQVEDSLLPLRDMMQVERLKY